MNFHLVLDDWAALQADAKAIRHEVFIIEQNIPLELEWDEINEVCVHAVAYDEKSRPVGTGRLLPDGHIGRMAVSKAMRGAGVGGAILEALMQHAKQRGDAAIMLSAQVHAERFYQRYGFVRDGDEFMEAGIPHIHMRYILR